MQPKPPIKNIRGQSKQSSLNVYNRPGTKLVKLSKEAGNENTSHLEKVSIATNKKIPIATCDIFMKDVPSLSMIRLSNLRRKMDEQQRVKNNDRHMTSNYPFENKSLQINNKLDNKRVEKNKLHNRLKYMERVEQRIIRMIAKKEAETYKRIELISAKETMQAAQEYELLKIQEEKLSYAARAKLRRNVARKKKKILKKKKQQLKVQLKSEKSSTKRLLKSQAKKRTKRLKHKCRHANKEHEKVVGIIQSKRRNQLENMEREKAQHIAVRAEEYELEIHEVERLKKVEAQVLERLNNLKQISNFHLAALESIN